jgi:hypothetical protein
MMESIPHPIWGKISWPAIVAGAVAGVGLNFLLNLLSLGLHFASFSIDGAGNLTFSFFGYLSFCVSGFIAMFFTGWISASAAIPLSPNKLWGVLHGFLAWSLLLMLTIILITNMIQYTAFHSNFTAALVAIKITNNAPMTTETFAKISDLESSKKILTLNAILTFILFFIGALSSCLGGYLGYKPTNKDEQSV